MVATRSFKMQLQLVALMSAVAMTVSGSVRPNILFFLADDMGYGDVGYLSTGSAHGKLLTPTLDKMATEGMTFTEAYAGAPVCAPSRCTLVTGRHSGHCTVRSNGPTLGPGDADVGFPEVLRSNGYHTRHIGKWGLGTFDDGASPLDKGFEYYYGQMDQGYCHNYYPSYMDFGTILANGTHNTSEITIPDNVNATVANCGKDLLKCSWSGDLWTAETLRFLQEQGNLTSPLPWMLYLSYTAPHAGDVGNDGEGQPPVPRISTGPYESRAAELGKEIGYASAVTEMDRQLSLVLGGLESAGLASNTVVFFASDNGASNEGDHSFSFFNSSGPLNGFKRCLHEGGHRSALLVRWPGQIAAGSKSKQQFAFYDFFATALELAGLDPTTSLPTNQRDGTSLVPTLLGKPQAQKDFVYHEYCGPCENPKGWGQSLRIGDWSGVCIGDKPTNGWPVCTSTSFLLYNLSTDLGQTTNVATSNPLVVTLMMNKMKTVRVNGHYCGEPDAPTPPPSPVPLAKINGTWLQKTDPITIIVDTTTQSITITTTSGCCEWTSATGNITTNGEIIMIDAVGPEFSTKERGTVTSDPEGDLTITWVPIGGADKQWHAWKKSAQQL